MNELIKKLISAEKIDALESLEALQKAAAELGFGADEVAAAMDDFDGFPLDDDDLMEITGGRVPTPSHIPPNASYSSNIPLL